VSTSARGADKTLKTWLLDPDDWTGSDQTRTKSMMVTGPVPVTICGDDHVPKAVQDRIVARWSAESAARDAHTRDKILARAEA
jgi:hypothetical protein